MDFDDLDDAIDERLADGDTTGMDGFAFEKKELKKFTGELPVIKATKGLVTYERAEQAPTCRIFVFYGPGDTSESLKEIGGVFKQHMNWADFVVHEWPGSGSRSSETMAEDLDALVLDAFEVIKPSMEQVKQDAEFEGAPFAFCGRSAGVTLMTLLAKKVLMSFGLAPTCVVVMDRAPSHMPLLSEAGEKALKDTPEKVVQAFKFSTYAGMDKDDVANIAKGYSYANETREPLFHKFDCDMMLLKGVFDGAIDEKGKQPSKYKVATLKIKGSKECMTMPAGLKTSTQEFLNCVRNIFAYSKTDELKALDEDGNEIDGFDPVKEIMTIDGLVDFKHPRHTWPHPVAIIGAGFFGVKMAMMYSYQKNHNVIMFDRLEAAGGYAWRVSATKHSRVQTDFGAFNIWFGHEYCMSGDGGFGAEKGGRLQFNRPFKGPGSPMQGTVASGGGTNMDANPVRHQVLGQLNYALKEYGGDKVCHFQTEVSSLKIIGENDWEGRCYRLGVHDLKTDEGKCLTTGDRSKTNNCWSHKLGKQGTPWAEDVKVSVIYHFPGAYDLNRIVTYPGEDKFGGQIGYGMGSGMGGLFVWEQETMKGKRCAVLGNGAFAVENVRSCIEAYCSKVFIVTRRKSLLCPRMPCWFCHQSPKPTPAPLLLDIFKPMYACAGINDPWSFYAVAGANEKKTICAIKQSSRFGIGDISFLAHAVGLFEFRVGVVERMSKATIHLSTGEKLEKMDHVCKALGLIGDPRVDQLHAMTHRLWNFVNSDWRRIISSDATGMDAMRFTTFSAGPGACQSAKQWYYIHQHPWEYRAAKLDPTWAMIPKHTLSATQPDQTIYQTNVQYEMHAGNILGNCWPSMYVCFGDEDTYKWCLVQTMHPTKDYFEYCKADWDRYQKLIKENCPGFENQKDVPYPYNLDMVDEWCKRYNKDCKMPFAMDAAGPGEDIKKSCLEGFAKNEKYWLQAMVPHLIKEFNLIKDVGPYENPVEEASMTKVYNLKKDLTATDEESGRDFDDKMYEGWKDYVAGANKLVEEMSMCNSCDLLTRGETWGQVLPFLGGKFPKPEKEE